MQQATTFEGTSAIPPPTVAAVQRERRFFGGIAVALTLTVFAGFSRTYYFNDWVAEPFALTPLLHWHGAAFSAWMLLLVAQTTLIAMHRVRLHMRLGVGGAVLAALLVPLGMSVAITRTASGAIAAQGATPLVFLAVPLIGMLVFAALVGAALYLRRDSATHKRLMILATVELATAGVARLPFVENWGPPGFFGVADLFVVALIVYDLVTRKRVHAATIWGALFLVVSQPLRLVVGGSGAWTAFATWLLG
jgi:hypothetical protein